MFGLHNAGHTECKRTSFSENGLHVQSKKVSTYLCNSWGYYSHNQIYNRSDSFPGGLRRQTSGDYNNLVNIRLYLKSKMIRNHDVNLLKKHKTLKLKRQISATFGKSRRRGRRSCQWIISGSFCHYDYDSGEMEWTIIIDHGLPKRYLGYGWIRYCKFTLCSYFLKFLF